MSVRFLSDASGSVGVDFWRATRFLPGAMTSAGGLSSSVVEARQYFWPFTVSRTFAVTQVAQRQGYTEAWPSSSRAGIYSSRTGFSPGEEPNILLTSAHISFPGALGGYEANMSIVLSPGVRYWASVIHSNVPRMLCLDPSAFAPVFGVSTNYDDTWFFSYVAGVQDILPAIYTTGTMTPGYIDCPAIYLLGTFTS